MTRRGGPGRDPDLTRLLAAANDALRLGALPEVERASRRVLASDAGHPEALNLLGTVEIVRGRSREAVALLEKAIERAPRSPAILCNLAYAFATAGRAEDAARRAEEAVRLAPTLTAAYAILGNALNDLHRPEKALAPLRKALELSPGLPKAVLALGAALHALGHDDEACRHYEDAVARTPGFADAWSCLGMIHVEARRYDEAVASLRSALVARRASPWWPGSGVEAVPTRSPTLVNALKLAHDVEQFGFLLDRGLLPDSFSATVERYGEIEDRIEQVHGRNANVLLSRDELGPIGDSFSRVVRWRETPRHPGPVLGLGWDRGEIQARYADPPGLCWIDGLLTPAALEDLRQFCLESTIWNDIAHNFSGGTAARAYLGTYASDGFCCPLLFQIAEELTRAMPAVFGDHRLHQMWAYKYEPESEGINLHGDDAAVNVNFWITPDAANRAPASGGLVVYPAEAPADWSFADMNRHPDRIRDFLASSGVAPVNVPYRQNRAVIFNSDLFHATAPLDFKPGYENRRINVTMLFGRRGGPLYSSAPEIAGTSEVAQG